VILRIGLWSPLDITYISTQSDPEKGAAYINNSEKQDIARWFLYTGTVFAHLHSTGTFTRYTAKVRFDSIGRFAPYQFNKKTGLSIFVTISTENLRCVYEILGYFVVKLLHDTTAPILQASHNFGNVNVKKKQFTKQK
jgi:hypothetical protein